MTNNEQAAIERHKLFMKILRSEIKDSDSSPDLSALADMKNKTTTVSGEIAVKKKKFDEAMKKWQDIMKKALGDGDSQMFWHNMTEERALKQNDFELLKSIKDYIEAIKESLPEGDKVRVAEIIKYLDIAIEFWNKDNKAKREEAGRLLRSKTHKQFYEEIQDLVKKIHS